MEYHIGDKINVRINKIIDKGCYCSFHPLHFQQYGFMPKILMPSMIDSQGNFMVSVGDDMIAVIEKESEKGIFLSDIETYEKEQILKQGIESFVSKYSIGDVFETEVVQVQNTEVIIKVGNVKGVIRKEDTNWNEVDRLDDLFFEGELINAVYVKHENGQLFFSLKLLNEKPYDDKLYDLTLFELLRYASHESNVFIGQAKRYHYGLFIENLYSDSYNQKGKLLIDPIYGYNLRALVPNVNFNVDENKYYRIELRLVPKNKRIERNQLFQFYAVNIEETENPYKADVKLTFAKSTSPRDCAALARTLAEVGKNMYSSKDRMFLELVQNADDAAAQRGVFVNLKSRGDFLIVRHNGNSFDKDDFDAITSSANGTKKANENKTGYKGIGFKSVFTDSEIVFIKTGGYQFKFDRTEPMFTDFERFYFFVNGKNTERERNDFLKKFNSERNKFRGVSDIPWQLEPIWVDEFPKELGDDFTQSNVSIALKLGEYKIVGDNGYNKAIEEVVRNPRFMLFLRNTKRIDFNGLSVSKITKNGIIILKNSFTDDRIEYFKREDFEIAVNNDVFEENAIDIRIVVEEQNEASGKIIEAKFVDINNHELENIPKKIAINNSTIISFAVPIEDDGALKPNTQCNEVSMFAFLPTLVKDFKFPFYVNANFILDPPRQRIIGDNPWNFYLMQEIALCLVRWSATLNEKQDKNALNVLLPRCFVEDSADTKQLAKRFNSAYKSAIESEAFILNHRGKLSMQSEIIIDKTDLSHIVGADLFCRLLGTDKFLPSENIDSKILSNQIFELIEHITNDILHHKLNNNEDLNEWYIHADKESKERFNKWVIENNYKDIISSLPIFEFDDGWKSPNEIDCNDKYVVISSKFSHLKNVVIKIGLHCSSAFDNTDLYQIDETKLFDRIYKKVEMHNEIVRKLHHNIDLCAGVGSDEYYYSSCYGNLLSDLRGGNFLTKKHEELLLEIKPKYIFSDEFETLKEKYKEENKDEDICYINNMEYEHYIFYDFPNVIRDIIDETALTPKEKLLLINTDFYNIGDARIKEIELFYSMDNAVFHNGGEPMSLQQMLPYRIVAPDYIRSYMICEEENFQELQRFLICPENEYERVVKPHLSEILKYGISLSDENKGFSLSDIIKQYKLEGPQLRDLIKEQSSACSLVELLPFVEDSDNNTKKYFLDSIKKLELLSTITYKKDSYEYRVLRLALDIYDEPSEFSSKIFFDGHCIKEFTISDDVICEYSQRGEIKKVKMSLVKILPQYRNQSAGIDIVKSVFENKYGFDKFFKLESKSLREIFDELNATLSLSYHLEYWPTGNNNVEQYLFSVYYRKCKAGGYEPYSYYSNFEKRVVNTRVWSRPKSPDIDLIQKEQSFVNELMGFLYNNDISVNDSPCTFHLKKYFDNKYFNSDLIFEKEQILPIIEQWADDDKKKKYLIDNGVRTENCNAIQFRKFFLENKSIDSIDKLWDFELSSGVEFIATANGIERPFKGDNQSVILLQLKGKKCCNISDDWDERTLEEKSEEWSTFEYKEWQDKHSIRIFVYHGLLPRKLSYNGELLLSYEDTSYNYLYNKEKRKLFVSSTKKIEDVLFEVAKERKSEFNFDDYKFLCWGEGKISIAIEDVERKDKTIETLTEENRKKDEIIKDLQAKLGMFEAKVSAWDKPITGEQFPNLPTPTIEVGGSDGIGEQSQWEAQIEAQLRLMQEFPKWRFPDKYGESNANGKPYNFSTVKIEDEDHNIISVVLKSYKKSSEPFKINTSEWDCLIKEQAVLLIYTGVDIKRIYVRDLIRKQSNISVSFSTENLDIEDKISAFADSLHYFNELHFDFESFNIPNRVQSASELYNRNKRAFFANDNSEEDI